ncbi:WhiB family transcriptional regulator [Nonomuraea sp. NPDC048916]|uniref:WhiB family transcriptional regulator n=1 Tax=Nonomuraea sp. NPDC048916 TaxID=3154232 RepID=UPI0033F20679
MFDWSRGAACLTLDPELFFPISTEGPGQEQVERAKAICQGCPVRQPCLDYAISTGQAYGIWGGADPSQRRALAARPVARGRAQPEGKAAARNRSRSSASR